VKPRGRSYRGFTAKQARRGSIEKMADRAKAHGVNVAISFGFDSNNIGDYNRYIWHDGIYRA
jgi:uncharacterized protein YbjQ (UPF0145 family)